MFKKSEGFEHNKVVTAQVLGKNSQILIICRGFPRQMIKIWEISRNA